MTPRLVARLGPATSRLGALAMLSHTCILSHADSGFDDGGGGGGGTSASVLGQDLVPAIAEEHATARAPSELVLRPGLALTTLSGTSVTLGEGSMLVAGPARATWGPAQWLPESNCVRVVISSFLAR